MSWCTGVLASSTALYVSVSVYKAGWRNKEGCGEMSSTYWKFIGFQLLKFSLILSFFPVCFVCCL